MADPEPFPLPVHCVHCGRPVTLLCEPRPLQPPSSYAWSCPYRDCRKDAVNYLMGFAGELLDEWVGHGPDPDDDPSFH